MGRTARGEGARGNALLFLIPEELQFLRYLKVKYFDYITWGNRTKTYVCISDNLSATLKTVMISVKLRQHDVLSLKSRKQDEKISCFFFFGVGVVGGCFGGPSTLVQHEQIQ